MVTRIYLSPAVSQAVLSPQLPPRREQGSVMSMDTSTAVRNASANAAVPSWDNTLAQPFSASNVQGVLLIIVATSIKIMNNLWRK